MDISDWQEILGREFTEGQVIGPQLLRLMGAENAMRSPLVEEYSGHDLLSCCWQEFYIETLSQAVATHGNVSGEELPPNYLECFLIHFACFRTLRCSDLLYEKGYPLAGFSLLRDLKDAAVMFSAVHSGLTTLRDLLGYDANPIEDQEERRVEMRRLRTAEERRVTNALLWDCTDLSEETLKYLRIWQDLFNQEIHGSRLTMSLEGLTTLRVGGIDPLSPNPTERGIGMFLNRWTEVSWMLLRCLPLLQLSSCSFSEAWSERWHLVDDAFRVQSDEFVKIRPGMGHAIEELMVGRFSMTPDDSYPDSAPSPAS